jgi:HAD superfamily hydrolase (TIGR01549 family)
MARRVIFLDWGGTLAIPPVEFREPWRVWSRALEEQGHSVDEARIRSAISLADRELGARIYDYVGRTGEYWSLHDARLMDLLHIERRRAKLEASVQRVFDDPALYRLFPETRSVLAALRAEGFRTGVISNHHDGLIRAVRFHGLEPWLDWVTYSQEAGAEKPDPAVFSFALRRAHCAPSEAIHVGDSIEADVEGARRSGIAAVWINRDGIAGAPECPVLSSLDELIPLLKRLA